MQRSEIFRDTGACAENAKIAKRLNKKACSILAMRKTVLFDFETLSRSSDILCGGLDLPDLAQVRVCRVTPALKAALLASGMRVAQDTLIP